MNQIKKISFIFLLIFSQLSFSEDKVMLVLDASGSMWGQIDGRNKIDIAKNALKKLLPNQLDKEIGLIVYGHREKGSCTDIETLIPVSKLDINKTNKIVDAISPKGKTPLSAAVKQAAEALKYTEDKATVILISDGIETCHLDPCKVGAELEKLGVDFTAHVIGFDIKEQEQQDLRCLATNTGGKFISAKNADELNNALDKVTKEEKRTLPKASLEVLEKVEKGTIVSITPKADKAGFTGFINLYPQGKNQHILSVQVNKDYSPVKMTMPVETGHYVLKWESMKLDVLAEKNIEVIDTEMQIIAPKTAKRTALVKLNLKAPQILEGYIRVFPKGEKEYVSEYRVGDSQEIEIQMPVKAGDYVLKWINQNNTEEIYTQKDIIITDATVALKSVDTAKKGEAITVQFEAPAPLEGYVYVYAQGSEEYESENRVGEHFSEGIQITVPETAGQYLLKWQTLEGVIYAEKTIQISD